MKKKILYVSPNSKYEYGDLNNEERIAQANKDENASVYTHLEDFAIDFNNEFISDLGYIYVIDE